MQSLIIVGIVVGIPLIAGIAFRVHAALLFMAVATGALLQQTVGESTALALAAFIKDGPVEMVANIGLIVLPVILTLVFLRKSMKKKEVLLQVVPLVAASLALAAVLMPFLPAGTEDALRSVPSGALLVQSLDVTVAVAAVLNLMLAWRSFHHKDEDAQGKHFLGKKSH